MFRRGRLIAENFFELPPKRDLPDYYEVIKLPVALDTIEGKLERREVPNLTALESLFHRMVENARTYNEEDSLIVSDAEKIRAKVTAVMKKDNPAYKTSNYTPFPTPLPGEEMDSDVDAEGEDDDDVDSASTPAPVVYKRRGRPPKDPNHPYYTLKVAPRASSGTPKRSGSQTTDNSAAGLTFQQAQERIVSDLLAHKEFPE